MKSAPEHPPIGYMRDVRRSSLRDFALSKDGRAACLLKEMRRLLEEYLVEKAEAMMAWWLVEHWDELTRDTPDPLKEALNSEPQAGTQPVVTMLDFRDQPNRYAQKRR